MTAAAFKNLSFEAAGGTSGAIVTTTSEPFVIADAQTLLLSIDGGDDQIISFDAANFVDITQATAAEVATEIDGQLTGATATVSGGTEVQVASDTQGDDACVLMNGGAANAGLEFPTEAGCGITAPGFAQHWTSTAANTAEEVALFVSAYTTVKPFESFEEGWLNQPVDATYEIALFDDVDGPFQFEDFANSWGLNPARLQTEAAETYNLGTSDTLTIQVNGAGSEVVTFNNGFITVGVATAEEVVQEIDADTSSAIVASVSPGGTHVRLETLATGTTETIQVLGGTGNVDLQFPTTVSTGSLANGPLELGPQEAGVFNTAPDATTWESFEREWSANEDFIYPPFTGGQIEEATFTPGPNHDSFESDWRDNQNFKFTGFPEHPTVELEEAVFDDRTTTDQVHETFEDPNDWDDAGFPNSGSFVVWKVGRILISVDGYYQLQIGDDVFDYFKTGVISTATIADALAVKAQNSGLHPEFCFETDGADIWIELINSGRYSEPDELPFVALRGPQSDSVILDTDGATGDDAFGETKVWRTPTHMFPFSYDCYPAPIP